MGLLFLYGFLTILLSFLCSILEAVLLSVNPTFIKIKIKEGLKYAENLQKLKNSIDEPLVIILTLNTIAHTVGAIMVGVQAKITYASLNIDNSYSFLGAIITEETLIGFVSTIMTILVLILSEIIPKTIGVKFARKLSINIAPVIYYINKIMFPITYVFNGLSKYLIKLTSPLVLDSQSSFENESKVTSLIDIGEDEGSIKKSESKIIDNLLKLQKINLIKILTPEPDLLIMPVETSRIDALVEIRKRRLSRIPIFKGDTDNVIGILHSKDLLNSQVDDISAILHEPYFVPDKKNVFQLLQEFQVKKTHIAIVLDEYGRLEGVVTLEDILQEIFGQIENERELNNNLIDYKKDQLEIGGGLRIIDFNESCLYAALRSGGLKALGEEISSSLIPENLDIETVGGFIFTNIGRLPVEGENIINGSIKLTVLKVLYFVFKSSSNIIHLSLSVSKNSFKTFRCE